MASSTDQQASGDVSTSEEPAKKNESTNDSTDANNSSSTNSISKNVSHTLFVGQLPFYATKESILEHFEQLAFWVPA